MESCQAPSCAANEATTSVRSRGDVEWESLCRQLGERYAACRLNNYEQTTDAQRAVVDQLREYAGSIRERAAAGEGIILRGPVGTGKDHLIAAMCRAALLNGLSVRYVFGVDLFREFRDVYSEAYTTERSLIREYTAPKVLVISDPLPPGDELSGREQEVLMAVIHGRYKDNKPTWITINTSLNAAEIASALSMPIFDRLRHGSLVLHCDWPSYRKSRSV